MNNPKTSKRILALDILRGITIAGMIMVNNPGNWGHIYAPLEHAEWIGLTPTDLVFPFFMFIMGISTYISLKKYDFEFSRSAALKILKRTAIIFLIGLAIGWFARLCYYWAAAPGELSFGENLWASVWTFDRMRILGVMQRLALCYGATSIIALTMKHRHIPYLIAGLLISYFILLMCGNGFAYNETNILSVVDRAVLTPAHMYKDNGIDPEGLLSTIPSIAHVLLGFCVGRMMLGDDRNAKADRMAVLDSHLIKLLLTGAILTFAGFLLSYGCPISKKIWSPTFVLVTCGMASSFLALLIWIVDVKGYRKWSVFFESFGVNPLFMYVAGDVLAILFGVVSFPWDGGSITIHGILYDVLLAPLFGETGGSLAYALAFIAINWCIGYQLYKRKIYIKI
ncbi:acyltransferase family protein [Bacteroides helcogenes]|uniref:Transmembrane protein n=1 Tax=Bacteroides helcogenes (strain ATCC 35417 / DSM 20613 / JCM 6297 / CCUG 15421 / P 36-108) TaxID=693979 RepID=E6SUZ1_BACT6|nr:heparan-alpha-glucosaminide N-acetyltransferase domain-containing protein [Bacteroides helcogenes]ADV42427.1 putative transmembrane protein [Bacteroides helcogenes P 36-108]MDY5238070.1 heparan-alpha-glucosaminide N-acetyltransferase domain-containing protein [Bacteroides helcogenes]